MGKVVYLNSKRGGQLMITVFDVAKMFLTKEAMTNKKLQKLCYYAQAWHLALTKKRLFSDNIEAWVHGPVIPKLYFEYKEWARFPISRENEIPTSIEENENIKQFLDGIYEIYGNKTGDQLEALTHIEEPWMNAREGLQPSQPSTNIISDEDMSEFYAQKLI